MRYHTTFKDIAVSILVLACCAAICLVGMLYFGMENPSEVATRLFVQSLDRGGAVVLKAERIDRTYLANLIVHNLSITLGDDSSVHVQQLKVQGGLPRLLASYFFGSQQLAITLDGVEATLKDLNFTTGQGGKEGGGALAAWLKANVIDLKLVNADIAYMNEDLKADTSGGSIWLHLDASNPFPAFLADLQSVSFSYDTFQGSVEKPEIVLDSKGTVVVNGSNGNVNAGTMEFGFERVALHTSVTSTTLLPLTLDADLSLGNLHGNDAQFQLEIPTISGHVSIDATAFKSASLSYDKLDFVFNDYVIASPTATIQVDNDANGWHLGLATKQAETLVVSYQTDLVIQADTLNLDASYNEGILQTKVSLDRAQYQQASLDAELSSVFLSAEGTVSDQVIADFQLNLIGNADVLLKDQEITFSSPVYSTLWYSQANDAFSTSISLGQLNSSFTTVGVTSSVFYQANPAGRQLQAELMYQDQFNLRMVWDISEHNEQALYITGRLDSLPIAILNPTIETYAPFLKPYYQDTTNLIGNISFQSFEGRGGTMLPINGRSAVDLALLNAKVGELELDAGFTLLADIEDDFITVDTMALASSGYRLAFNGTAEIGYWLPRGTLELFKTEDGSKLLNISFADQIPDRYRFQISTPRVQSFIMDGVVRRDGAAVISGDASIAVLGHAYPLIFSFDAQNVSLLIEQEEHLNISVNLAPPLHTVIVADSFELPPEIKLFGGSLFSGNLQGSFNGLSDWSAESEALKIEQVSFQGRSYALETSLAITSDSLELPDMVLSEGSNRFTSRLSYHGTDFVSLFQASFFAPFEASFELKTNQDPKISLSLIGEEQRLGAVIQLSTLPLDRFAPFLQGIVIDGAALLSTDFKESLDLEGDFELTKNDAVLRTKLMADPSTVRFFDTTFSMGELHYRGDLLTIDTSKAILQGRVEHVRHLSYMDQLSHIDINLALDVGPTRSVFELPASLKRLKRSMHAELTLSDIKLLGEGGLSDATYAIDLKEDLLTVTSEHLDLNYEHGTKHIQANLDPAFGIGLSAEGIISGSNFGLKVSNLYFPLSLLNRAFLKPVFGFLDGVAQGEVYLSKGADGIQPYGQLYVNSTRMQVFWLPQDIITMKNVSATIDGNRAITPNLPFFSTNTVTGETIEGYGWLGASFNGLNLANYEIHIDAGQEMVYVWIPIAGFGVDIRSYGGGTFNLFGIGYETWLDGKLTIQDTTMTLGIKELPSWYVSEDITSAQFDLVTGKNVSFFYPNTPNPFIRATIGENQTISFNYDHTTGQFVADGNLAFRSGEIYYFQKNFFITEGALSLHTDALSGRSQIQPTVNLRAKLTDFDSQGNRVDIYLVLRESNLTNLNPQLESIPSKDVNEILEILGQSILPTGAYGQVNLYSVASLAAAATDVAERLGFIDTLQVADLTEAIRISLGLDMFSIRSNILQNILVDALPGGVSTLSPIARYLNNTSIFMGKYIGQKLFLQALLHLSAMEMSRVRRAFISPDLSLDLELSLDWTTPMGTLSFFTQPNELSFTNILDTIGFSVTKRIVLR